MTDEKLDSIARDIETIAAAQGGAASWDALTRVLRGLVAQVYEERPVSPVVQRSRVAPTYHIDLAPDLRRELDQAEQVCANVASRISNAEIKLFGIDDPDHPADVLALDFVARAVDEIERLRGDRSPSRDDIELSAAVLRENLDMDTPEWAAMCVLLDACSKVSADGSRLGRVIDRYEETAAMLEGRSTTWGDPSALAWDVCETRARAAREDIAWLKSEF